MRLAEAVANWRWQEVAHLRAEGIELMGKQPTSDAILVASGFNGITRVADAIGIRLDEATAEATIELRILAGINDYAPAEKWA